jgi:YD repeat-containing protein
VKIDFQSSGSQPNMSGPIRRLHLIYLPLCELLPELLPPELRAVLQSFELLQKRYAIKVKSSTGSIALTQVTYSNNTTQRYTYDFRKNKLTETDQLGRISKYVYDPSGQLTSATAAFGTSDAATTSYTYDLDGRKLTETDPSGNAITYAYDAASQLSGVKDAAGNLTTYTYDSKGQRVSMTDAKNRVTTYTYDARGRRVTTTTPDGKIVTRTYDGLGLRLTETVQAQSEDVLRLHDLEQ